EFFKVGKAHLRPGGIFTQWIHFYGIRPPELKSVIRTFHTVFPRVLIFYTEAGDLILLGSEKPFSLDRTEIARRMETHAVRLDLARVDVYNPFDLWSYFLLGPDEIDRYVGNAALNTDDDTLVEFQTPKSLFEDTMSIHIAEMKGSARAGRGASRRLFLARQGIPPGKQRRRCPGNDRKRIVDPARGGGGVAARPPSSKKGRPPGGRAGVARGAGERAFA